MVRLCPSFGGVSAIRLHVFPPVETTGLKSKDAAALREQVRRQIVEQLAAWRGLPPAQVADPVPSEAMVAE